jgi:hypothetical protein
MDEGYMIIEGLLEVSIDPTNQSVHVCTNIKDINELNAKMEVVLSKALKVIELIKFNRWSHLTKIDTGK